MNLHQKSESAYFTHSYLQIPRKWRSSIIHPFQETFSAKVKRKVLGDWSNGRSYTLGTGSNGVWLLRRGMLYRFASNSEHRRKSSAHITGSAEQKAVNRRGKVSNSVSENPEVFADQFNVFKTFSG